MKENLKSKRGITLIALIITIIILLILAIVTINILINEGIIGHAKNAVETYDEKQVQEDLALTYQEWKMGQATGSSTSMADFFKSKYGNDAVVDNGDGSITVTVESNGNTYAYKIKADGSMEATTGISLDKSSLALEYKEGTTVTGTVKATLTGITGDVTWSIADSSIATISSTSGEQITVTAVKKGTTKITAKAGKYSKECTVKVQEALDIGAYINYDCGASESNKLYYKSLSATNGYGDQEFEITSNPKWKILGRSDSGNILITTSDPIVPTTGGKDGYFGLKGKAGYVNGPDELDAISEIFGHGAHATGARSIRIEDVNKITGQHLSDTYTKYTYTRNAEDGKIYRNGATSGSGSMYRYYENDDPKGEWKQLASGETSPEIEQTYYVYSIGNSNAAQKMLSKKDDGSTNASYWLASRCVNCSDSSVDFPLRNVNSGLVSYNDLYNSGGYASTLRQQRSASRSFSIV